MPSECGFNRAASKVWHDFIKGKRIKIKVTPNRLKDHLQRVLPEIRRMKVLSSPIQTMPLLDELDPEQKEAYVYLNTKTYDSLFDYYSWIYSTIPKGFVNCFYINDSLCGKVCEQCGATEFIVLLMDDDYTSMDGKSFIPCVDVYNSNQIDFDSEDFNMQFPVPINHETDYWYCINCEKFHRFGYDTEQGLYYDQTVAQV